MYDLRLLFFNHRFKLEDYECNGCHGLAMLSANISNFAIIIVKNLDYCCIVYKISKSDVIIY